jgi:NAD+ synthase (glutamine-hydrolysing)
MLARILAHADCQGGMLLDIGMPVRHRNRHYNCRVLARNGRILLLRPKMWLAQDGNYREARYFTPWPFARRVEQYDLRHVGWRVSQQQFVPFGDAVVSTRDTCIGAETCEELFTPDRYSFSSHKLREGGGGGEGGKGG